MKRLLALASLLVLGVSLGVTALFASSGATGAWGADPSFASSGPIPVGHLPIGVAALSAASGTFVRSREELSHRRCPRLCRDR